MSIESKLDRKLLIFLQSFVNLYFRNACWKELTRENRWGRK